MADPAQPLQHQVVNVPFKAGVDQSVGTFSLELGQLQAAENVRFEKDGSVRKRKGYTGAITTGINPGEGRIVANGKELLVLDGKNVISYTADRGQQTICPAPRFTATTDALYLPPTNIVGNVQCVHTHANGNKTLFTAWVSQTTFYTTVGGQVYTRAYDLDTLQPIATTGLTVADKLNSGSADCIQVQLFTTGTYVVAVYARAATTGSIWYRYLDPTTMAWSAEFTISSVNKLVGTVANTFAAGPIAGEPLQFVWASQRSTDDAVYVSRHTITTNAIVTGQVGPDISIYPSSGFGICATKDERIFVTYGWDANDGQGLRLQLMSMAYGAGTVEAGYPFTVRVGGWSGPATGASVRGDYCYMSGVLRGSNATSCVVSYTNVLVQPNALATDPWAVTWGTFAAKVSGTTVGNYANLGDTRMLSAPFSYGSRHYILAQRDTGEFAGATWANVKDATEFGGWNGLNAGTASIMDLRVEDAAVGYLLDDCIVFPEQLAVTDGTVSFRPSVQYIGTDYVATAATWNAGQKRKSLNLIRLATGREADKSRYFNHYDGSGVIIGGGLVCSYDRASVYPVNFVTSPVWARYGQTANVGGAGWSFAAPTDRYYVRVIWERVDGYGRVAYSAPDFGIKKDDNGTAATIADGIQSVAWVQPSAAASICQWNYPTPSDGWEGFTFAGGGSSGRTKAAVYTAYTDTNDLKRLNTTGSSFGVGLVISNTHTSPVLPDNDAAAPYTLGGAVPNIQPPCLSGLIHYGGRLVGIDPSRRAIWFSKTLLSGELPAFAPDFTISSPFAVEALGVLDEKLIVFGRSQIGAVSGGGPSDTGAGGSYPDVQVVVTDKGILDSRSVVQIPSGLMFRGPSGIYLLDRSLNVNYVGLPVRDTLETYPVVTSAIVHPTETCVLFACTSTDANTGRRLVYDYRLQRWSVDSVLGGAAILSQCVVDSKLYILTHSYLGVGVGTAQVWVESDDYLDNSAWVTMRLKLAPARLAGLQGYQRVWKVAVLGERSSDHNLTVTLYSDDRAASDQVRTFPHATTSLTYPEKLEMRCKRQLCRAVTVELSDSTPTGGTVGTGAGVVLGGVSFEIGVLPDMARTPATRRA